MAGLGTMLVKIVLIVTFSYCAHGHVVQVVKPGYGCGVKSEIKMKKDMPKIMESCDIVIPSRENQIDKG